MVTNYEKIKNMTIDEMASWLRWHINCDECPADEEQCILDCKKRMKQWLLSEVE